MSNQRYVFTKKRGERLKFTHEELEEAYSVARGYGADALVHPEIVKYTEDFWIDQTHRLQFENPSRTWDQCSREIARRHSFVYLSRSPILDSDQVSYDIDLKEVK